jgi:hypothetical protein
LPSPSEGEGFIALTRCLINQRSRQFLFGYWLVWVIGFKRESKFGDGFDAFYRHRRKKAGIFVITALKKKVGAVGRKELWLGLFNQAVRI